jgi:hypothetical protein
MSGSAPSRHSLRPICSAPRACLPLLTLPGWEGIPRSMETFLQAQGNGRRMARAVGGRGPGQRARSPVRQRARAAVRVRAALENVEKVLIRLLATLMTILSLPWSGLSSPAETWRSGLGVVLMASGCFGCEGRRRLGALNDMTVITGEMRTAFCQRGFVLIPVLTSG